MKKYVPGLFLFVKNEKISERQGEGLGRISPILFLLRLKNNVKNEKQIFNRLFITLQTEL